MVGEGIAEQLQKRAAFRALQQKETLRVTPRRASRFQLFGRIGGAEIDRSKNPSNGSIPCTAAGRHQALARSLVARLRCHPGIKVGIYRGLYAD